LNFSLCTLCKTPCFAFSKTFNNIILILGQLPRCNKYLIDYTVLLVIINGSYFSLDILLEITLHKLFLLPLALKISGAVMLLINSIMAYYFLAALLLEDSFKYKMLPVGKPVTDYFSRGRQFEHGQA